VPYSRSNGFGTAKLGLIFKLCQQNIDDVSPSVDPMGVGWNRLLAEMKDWLALKTACSCPPVALDNQQVDQAYYPAQA
jgi:hypothetical protein